MKMSSKPSIKKTTSKEVAPKAAAAKPVAKPTPQLEVGAISKSGLWKIEAFRLKDRMWIIIGTKANIEFHGRAALSEKAALEILQK